MSRNPFKYDQALDPERDQAVCLPREEKVNKVINGIMDGDYWAVFGPAQIGKTTFLRLVRKSFPHACYLYVDFNTQHPSEVDFYRWLRAEFENQVPAGPLKIKNKNREDFSPSVGFIQFLESFEPEISTQKIVLLVDNVEGSPYVNGFLRVWRKIYSEKIQSKTLSRYSIIVTGSKDLILLSRGPTSPFNVAEKMFLEDLSAPQVEELVNKPLQALHIIIDPEATHRLLSEIKGHPQLLQHACHILVDRAAGQSERITEQDVIEVTGILIKENSSLQRLKEELEEDYDLRELVKDVLKGEKRKFLPYKDLSISGAGAVSEKEDHCVLRNRLYERVIRDLLQ